MNMNFNTDFKNIVIYGQIMRNHLRCQYLNGSSECVNCHVKMNQYTEKLHLEKYLYKQELTARALKVKRVGILSGHLNYLDLNKSIIAMIWNYVLD